MNQQLNAAAAPRSEHLHVSGLTDPENRVRWDKEFPPTFEVSGWSAWTDKGRLRVLRRFTQQYGRDPRIRDFTVDVIRSAGVQPRDYPGQARAILRWVQENIYYINESGEQVQSPFFTLRRRYGDCDDMGVLLGAMAESVMLPWRFCLAGSGMGNRPIKHHEGGSMPWSGTFSHIYVQLGWPPLQPTTWVSAEPTIRGVPLGYDVVDHGVPQSVAMPEMGKRGLSGWITGREGWRGWSDGVSPEAVAAAHALQLPVPQQAPPSTFWDRIDWSEIMSGAVSGTIVSVTVALLTPLVIASLRRRNGRKR